MKDETKAWIDYAAENLASARVLLQSALFNPCLQNVRQSVEKHLKALLVEGGMEIRKTHSIFELVKLLGSKGISVGLTEDECDLFDTIYLPSKYPLVGVLPDFVPNEEICRQCLDIAENVESLTVRNLGKT